jgi:hypothetical protein
MPCSVGGTSRCITRAAGAESADPASWLQSGIHGWGLFAKCALPQDSMVMEYRGEVVRCAMPFCISELPSAYWALHLCISGGLPDPHTWQSSCLTFSCASRLSSFRSKALRRNIHLRSQRMTC